MKETQKEVDQILQGTRVSAEKLKDEIIKQAEIEAKKILEASEENIKLDHDRMYETLKTEMKDIAIEITKKILDKNLDSNQKDLILKKSMKYLENEK